MQSGVHQQTLVDGLKNANQILILRPSIVISVSRV